MKNQYFLRTLQKILVISGTTILTIAGSHCGADLYSEFTEAIWYTHLQQEYTRLTEFEKDMPQSSFEQKYPCVTVDHESLLQKNEDYIGWIYIPDSKISYPVVNGIDNSFYLHKNLEKEYSYPGTIFLDSRCSAIDDAYTILYGHNMGNGSMFADLKKYQNQSYFDTHPVFWFSTKENQNLLFEVITCCIVPQDDLKIYTPHSTLEDREYHDILQYIQSKSTIFRSRDSKSTDEKSNIMILSTCMPNHTDRCIVIGQLAD